MAVSSMSWVKGDVHGCSLHLVVAVTVLVHICLYIFVSAAVLTSKAVFGWVCTLSLISGVRPEEACI